MGQGDRELAENTREAENNLGYDCSARNCRRRRINSLGRCCSGCTIPDAVELQEAYTD